MKKSNRLLAALLTVLMLLQSFSFAAPVQEVGAALTSQAAQTVENAVRSDVAKVDVKQFEDFPNDWSTPAMTAAVNNGLLIGTSETTIEPKKNLTRAEMTAIISRAFGATVPMDISNVKDVTPADWFYSPVALSYQMGVFQGVSPESFLPRDFIRREDMFLGLARVLVLEDGDGSELHAFVDGSQVDSWAVGAMDAMVRDDYLNGYEDKTLRPGRNITRAEVAQVFYNIIDTYISAPGDYTKDSLKGTVLVRAKDVFIHDATIDGDLIVADGVGDGNFTMENVHVTGRILFRGGEGTVTFKNVTSGGKVVISDPNGTVNFHNYRSEVPFKNNLIEYTPATFLEPKEPDTKPSGPSSGPGGTGITQKFAVKTKFYFQNLDGTYPQEPTIVSTKSVSKYASTKAETNTDLSKLVDNNTITQAQYDEWVNGFEWDNDPLYADEDDTIRVIERVELERHYKRKLITVTVKDAFGNDAVPPTLDLPYGSQLPDPASTPDGYNFDGWTTQKGSEEDKLADGYKVKEPITIYPIFKPENDNYTSEYYFQELDGTTYTINNDLTYSGKVILGTTVTAEDKSKTGFTLYEAHPDSLREDVTVPGLVIRLSSYYNRNTHKMSVEIDGNEVYSIDDVMFGASVDPTLFPVPGIDDYNPATQKLYWTIKGQSGNIVDFTTFTMPDKDVIFVPKVVTNDKAQYKVVWYTQKADLSGYEELDTENRLGVIGATVSVTDEDKTAPNGFVLVDGAPSVFSGTVADDANPADILVLSVYFDREVYRVSFKNEDGTELDFEEIPYGGSITKNPTLPDGFKKQFAGWSTVQDDHTKIVSDLSDLDVTQPIDLYPIFKYQYTFRYWHESMSNPGNYNWQDEADVSDWGFAGETKYAPAYTAPVGYHLSTVKENETEITIVKDGVNVAQMFYDLNTHKMSVEIDGNEVYSIDEVKFGSKVDETLFPKPNYEPATQILYWVIKGQPDNVIDFTTFTMPDEPVIFVPVIKTNDKAQYKVVWYTQKADLSGYEELDTENRLGVIGATVSVTDEDKTAPNGFVLVDGAPSVFSGTVADDANPADILVLSVYFDREVYRVSFKNEDGTEFDYEEVAFGNTITKNPTLPDTATKQFAGWSTVQDDHTKIVSDLSDLDVTQPIDLYPIFKYQYTFEYYLEKLDGTYEIDANATKTDFAFAGQSFTTPAYTAPEGFVLNTDDSDVSITVTKDGENLAKAYYDRIKYTVSFMNEDGKTPAVYTTEEVKFGGNITTNANLTLTTTVEGKSFAGWTTVKGDKDTLVDLATVDVTQFNTFYPIFKFEYTIKYYKQNEQDDNYTELTALEVNATDYEGAIIIPTIAPDAGYAVNTEKSDEEGAVLNSKLTLEIYYDRADYTVVRFMNEEGKTPVVVATENVMNGEFITINKDLTLTTEVEGKSFAGWTTTKGDADTIVSDLTTVDVTQFNTFYPIFKFEYTIKYYTQNLDDDNYTESSASDTDYEGVTIVPNVTVPEGFVLNAEKSDEEGAVLNSKLTLEIYYDRIKYTVNFMNEDGKEPAVYATEQVKHGGKITENKDLTITTEVEGKSFAGWTTTKGDANTIVSDLTTVDVTKVDTLYPIFKFEYTIKYYEQNIDDNNYTELTALQVNGSDYEGATVTPTVSAPEGFALNAEKSDEEGVVLDSKEIIEVYYDRVLHTVKFYNEKSEELDTITVKHGGKITQTPTVPAEIAGIPFRGWSTDGTLQRVLDLDTYTVTDGDETNPIKLYAVYDDSDITYTVTFKVDGETYGNVQTVASSGYATVPADPEKTNFSFLYWYLEGDAQQTQVDVANYVILENTVFVAKFDEVFATVRFFNPAKPAASQLIKTIDTYHIGDTIVEADFPAKRRDKNGYNIDASSSLYSGVYTEDYQHKITSQWLYQDENGKWQVFKPDETPIPESGTLDLWNYFMLASFTLDSSKMPMALILDAYYEPDTRAAVSVKDAIFGGKEQFNNILSMMDVENKIYSKLAEKGLVEAGSNEIMNVNKQVNFVTVAGEEFVNNFLDEQLDVNTSMSNQELLDKYGVVFLQSENTINMFFGDKYYQDAVYSWYKETVYDEFLINEAHSDSFANILLEYDEAKLMVFDKFAPQEVLDLGLSNEQKLQYINDNIDDFKTPELINKIEHDPDVKALVLDEEGEIGKAIKEKVFGDYAVELKEYLKEYIKTHAEALIRDHGMEIIEANPALADEYKKAHEKEIEEALVLLKWELANKDQFTVNEDTVMIVMALEEYLLEMRDFNDFKAEYLSQIPDKLFSQLPMDEVILPLYNRTLEAYLAQVIGALEKADKGIYGADNMVDSGVTLRFNPISEIYIPMHKWAMENYDALADKLSGRDHAVIDKYMQYYDANPYNHALVKLSNPENYFNGTARDYTEKFSGYSLKGFDDLYEMIKAASVLVDDTFLWYCENVAPEDVEMVLDKFEERILHYVNYAVGLAETFAEDGIPGSLQELVNEIMIDDMLKNDIIKVGDKVTDKDVLEYIDKLAANSTANGAYDKLEDKFAARLQVVLQKFSESKFNKTYTEEDYERGKEILNKIHVDNNAQITTNFIFDSVFKSDSKVFTFRELVEAIFERTQG